MKCEQENDRFKLLCEGMLRKGEQMQQETHEYVKIREVLMQNREYWTQLRGSLLQEIQEASRQAEWFTNFSEGCRMRMDELAQLIVKSQNMERA